ncbi:NUDIX domain-containing protein [Pontivivens ytuae]|uniref:NUDIX domain-containing protein n=1 Tax=Pontivivens ytuae TaxID=2789856 RepID=UPI001E457960|nr:NUDIX domain-containing protein [Pontivivens ytuae]
MAALIHDGRGRLLLQRKGGSQGWSLPAGGIEPGETPIEALRREVLEETGMTFGEADLVSVLGGAGFRYRYPNGDHVEYTVAVFRCRSAQPSQSVIDPETQELKYFAEADMPPLAQPYPKAILFQ